MPYTLSKGLLWFLIALLIGVVIGWLLRSITVTRRLRAARAGRADLGELERLRERVASLQSVVDERDRLKAELAELREQRTSEATAAHPPETLPGTGPEHDVGTTDEHLPELDADGGLGSPSIQSLATEIDPLPEDSAPGAIDRDEPPLPEENAAPTQQLATQPADDYETPARVDLEGAPAILGKKVKLDDLTAIEGIGPAIAGLCNGIGIHTWSDLADTEVSLLRTMLADAGPRFSVHVPDTWPQQAALLAAGRWQDFTDLVSRISGGKLTG